jgi:GDP-4-dehydro-6-deoxy-D-mannose reductase
VKVLITGSSGFIGGFLAAYCANAGSSVLGIDIKEPTAASSGSFERCDVRDFDRLSKLISEFGPERIFHLAAQSCPTTSLVEPQKTIESNVVGTVNLFESLRALELRPIVVVACSSAEYGPIAPEDLPVRETHPLHPSHPYGVSKVAQDLLALQYFTNDSIPAIRLRIFKTTGPGKLGEVCSDLARRAVEIEMGIRPPVMPVGNLTSHRSIVDVRDLVGALGSSADYCTPGEVYNVGGSNNYSVQELIEAIRAQVSVFFTVNQRPELMRLVDEPVTTGNNSKFEACTGWHPKIPLDITLRDIMSWWRTRLNQSVEMQQPRGLATVQQ